MSNEKEKDFLKINESAKTERIVAFCEAGVNVTGNILNALTFGWSQLLGKVGDKIVDGYFADNEKGRAVKNVPNVPSFQKLK